MVLWWIGNAILLLVVLPVVIYLLNRVLAAVERIRAATDDILAGGVELVGELTVVPDGLAVTDSIVISALIIAITALGLLRVIFHLRAIRKTLVATTGGVQAVAQLTSTVPERLTSVNASLKPVRDFCETV